MLLHHVMGEAAGKKGVWSYVQGGMGMVSHCIAQAAKEAGAEIATNATVQSILYDKHNKGTQRPLFTPPVLTDRLIRLADCSMLLFCLHLRCFCAHQCSRSQAKLLAFVCWTALS